MRVVFVLGFLFVAKISAYAEIPKQVNFYDASDYEGYQRFYRPYHYVHPRPSNHHQVITITKNACPETLSETIHTRSKEVAQAHARVALESPFIESIVIRKHPRHHHCNKNARFYYVDEPEESPKNGDRDSLEFVHVFPEKLRDRHCPLSRSDRVDFLAGQGKDAEKRQFHKVLSVEDPLPLRTLKEPTKNCQVTSNYASADSKTNKLESSCCARH